jgi:GNAT superfamily N-acetyltransferase
MTWAFQSYIKLWRKGFVKTDMQSNKNSVVIRPFVIQDAEVCFNLRHEAFTQVFSQELSLQAVDVGANAYNPIDFGRFIGGMDTFVAVDEGQPVGFCTLRVLNATTAEILYLYVGLDRIKRGIGSSLVRYVESWVARQYPEISRLVLDTA